MLSTLLWLFHFSCDKCCDSSSSILNILVGKNLWSANTFGCRAKICPTVALLSVQGMTLNCIHVFIVTGSFSYWFVMRPASQRFFIHCCIYLRILIISSLATFLGTNSLSVLMCHKAVNQSINQQSLPNVSLRSVLVPPTPREQSQQQVRQHRV